MPVARRFHRGSAPPTTTAAYCCFGAASDNWRRDWIPTAASRLRDDILFRGCGMTFFRVSLVARGFDCGPDRVGQLPHRLGHGAVVSTNGLAATAHVHAQRVRDHVRPAHRDAVIVLQREDVQALGQREDGIGGAGGQRAGGRVERRLTAGNRANAMTSVEKRWSIATNAVPRREGSETTVPNQLDLSSSSP